MRAGNFAITTSTAAVALIAAMALLLAAPGAAGAGHASKKCGIVAKGASDWRVKAGGVRCGRARDGIRLYLRNGGELRGFFCSRTGGFIYCAKGSRHYSGQRL